MQRTKVNQQKLTNHKAEFIKSWKCFSLTASHIYLIGIIIAIIFIIVIANGTTIASNTTETKLSEKIDESTFDETVFVEAIAGNVQEDNEPEQSEFGLYDIPDEATGQKTWMDFRTITDPTSDQWKLQQQAWTDEYGFRRYNNMYMIAVGTYYAGEQCGKTLEVTFEDGTVIDCIVGDIKADRDTDSLNQHRNGNIVEFIVDTKVISDDALIMGDMTYARTGFNGKPVEIKNIS